MKKFIITVDGPAASGKGTLCKLISKDLYLHYLETGLYYRAFAYSLRDKNDKQLNVLDFITNLSHSDLEKNLKEKNKLYSEEITQLSSRLAKLEIVRNFIVSMQKFALKNFDKSFNGIILEGRDCGTVIAPKADAKIYLTADVEIRAKRRFEQFVKENKNTKFKEVLNDLNDRDVRDTSRKHSPLKKADDAFLLDNTNLNFDQTINIVKNIIFSKIPTLKKKLLI